MYYPEKIEKQIKFLCGQKNREIVLYSDYELIDESSKHLATCVLNHRMLKNKPIYALLRGSVNGITMLIPRSALIKCGNFDASLRCTQDYDMWYRMIHFYKFIHLKMILSKTRLHSLQDTVANPKTIVECDNLWIKMIRQLSNDEKIKLEGSLSEFYAAMIRFLRSTQYSGAIEYCQSELTASLSRENVRINDLLDILDKNWEKKEPSVPRQKYRSIPYRVLKKIYKEGVSGFLKAGYRRIVK
jgi:hypothetical protein